MIPRQKTIRPNLRHRTTGGGHGQSRRGCVRGGNPQAAPRAGTTETDVVVLVRRGVVVAVGSPQVVGSIVEAAAPFDPVGAACGPLPFKQIIFLRSQ